MAIPRLTQATHGRCYVNSSLLFLLAVLATVAVACAGDSSTTTPTSIPLVTSSAAPTASATPTTVVEPSPTPTETPLPTLTAVPSPTPTVAPSRPSVDVLADAALGYLISILDDLGPRESATQQELEAAEYLADRFEGFGYSVQLQPFVVESMSRELSSLVLSGPPREEVEVVPLVRSGTGEVSGNLVSVGLATEDDIPEDGLEGLVALAERGVITFEEKTNRLTQAGAVAVVIYNNRAGDFQGVVLTPASIPVVAISREDGLRIEELLSVGLVEALVAVKTEVRDSRNVIAELPGPGDGVIVLGGHYDTVPNISGANDNASGTAVLLTVAEELFREPPPFTVRLIAFGSEELGLLGSQHYVAHIGAERERIRAMFNFDALGTGNFGILGSRELTGLAEELATEHRIDAVVRPGLRSGDSDHSSFADDDIPVIMFFGDDFSRIHTPADTLELVSPEILGSAAALALSLLSSQDLLTILE